VIVAFVRVSDHAFGQVREYRMARVSSGHDQRVEERTERRDGPSVQE
jgi:hypothetical protein